MTDSTQNNDPAAAPSQLQGWVPDIAEPAALLEALTRAFDYRGDVTISTKDGRTLTGYIFDRGTGQGLDDSYVRLLPNDSDERQTIIYADITRLQFTGKDAAHGKTWENWLKRYAQSKRKGEQANLYGDEPAQD